MRTIPLPSRELDVAVPEEAHDFRGDMLKYYDDLNRTYAQVMSALLSGRGDDELVNMLISQLVVITQNLLPKIEGGGGRIKELLHEFQSYESWLNSANRMKTNIKEIDRIPSLYKLIIKAYDILGITSLG